MKLRGKWSTGVCVLGVLVMVLPEARAQETTEDRLRALEETVRRQQQRIEAQEQEIRRLRNEVPRIPEDETARDRFAEQVERSLQEREQPDDLVAGYRNGFFLGTRDNRFRLTSGGRMQADARFPESGHPTDSSFLVRRARLHLAGKLFEHFGFKVEGGFGEGKARLKDGYLNVGFTPLLEFRAGQFKEPFGLEELTSSRYVSLVERSMAIDNLAPGRDIGFMLHGKLFDDVLSYQVGVFNGAGENARPDTNDDDELALRLTLSPFRRSDNMWLKKLHVGAAATFGNRDESIAGDAFDTAVGTDFLTFSPGVSHNGRRVRLGGELAWLVGPASLRGEWIHSRFSRLEMGAAREDLDMNGWYTTATWLLTGEDATFRRITPRTDFNPSEGGWGAWELAARVGQLQADSSILSSGFATGTDRSTELAVGMNSYLNKLVTVRINYVRSWFDDTILVAGRSLDNEDAVLVRFQVEW